MLNIAKKYTQSKKVVEDKHFAKHKQEIEHKVKKSVCVCGFRQMIN